MGSICILTDSTAQFTQPSFPGRNLVNIVQLDIWLNQSNLDPGTYKACNLPFTATDEFSPKLIAPSPEIFRQLFLTLSQNYDEILGIFISSSLNSCFTNAENAARSLHGRSAVQIIDSQTTAIGLGLLVQAAAENAVRGVSFQEIEYQIRSLVPHIYAVLCTPNMTYLYYAGFLDQAQAVVGEMLGMLPIFSLEEGKLSPLEKVRNRHHTIDFFQEFLDEFEHLQHIALLQHSVMNTQDSRILREHFQDGLQKTTFTEHSISLPLAILLGPSASGLFLLESTNQKRK